MSSADGGFFPWCGVGFFQHCDAISFQLVFRNPECGIVSVRQVLEYVEIEIRERKQDGEAEYIWVDWLKYGGNEGNNILYKYLYTSGNPLQENPTKTKKQTPKQTPCQ